MKKIKILFTFILLLSINVALAGNNYKIENGVTCIWSGEGNFPLYFNVISYRLELYTDGTQKQYALYLKAFPVLNRGMAYFFPTHSKVLIKLMNDEVLELTSIYNKNVEDPANERICEAVYPISESDLQKIFTGIKKIRGEVLVRNATKDGAIKDFWEENYKKDKLGRKFKKFYDEINSSIQSVRIPLNNTKIQQSGKNIRDGF